MIFTALLAFVISVILIRLRVDGSVSFAIATVIPSVLTAMLYSGHVESAQDGIELLVISLICSAVSAALGFLFRPKVTRPKATRPDS